VLTKLGPAAFFTDLNLHALVVCRAINLSLEHGLQRRFLPPFEWLGAVAGRCFGDYHAGFRFGQLGYDLVEKTRTEAFSGQDLQQLCSSSPPLDATCQGYPRTAVSGVRNRKQDRRPYLAAFSCGNLVSNLLAAGIRWSRCNARSSVVIAYARKIGFGFSNYSISPQLGLVRDNARVDAEIRPPLTISSLTSCGWNAVSPVIRI